MCTGLRTIAVIWQTLPPPRGTESLCWCGELVQNQRNHVKGKIELFQGPCIQSQEFPCWVRWMTKFKGIEEAILLKQPAGKQPLGCHPSHIFDYHFLLSTFSGSLHSVKFVKLMVKLSGRHLHLFWPFSFVKLKSYFTEAGLRSLWTWATVLWCHWGEIQVSWERIYSFSSLRKWFGGEAFTPSSVQLHIFWFLGLRVSWVLKKHVSADCVSWQQPQHALLAEGNVQRVSWTFTFLWPWLLAPCSSL